MKNHSSSAFLLAVFVLAGASLVYVISSTMQVGVLPSSTSQTAQVSGALGQGLVTYWNFDETSGSSASDTSGNGNTASLSGTSWTSGRVGGGVNFNGSGTASRAVNLSGTSAVSMSMWLNGSSLANILETTTNFNSSQTGVLVFVNDSPTCGANTIGVELKGNVGYNVKCYSYPGSGWHHYAFIFDKSQPGTGEVSLYVDGSLQQASSNPQKSDNTNTFGSDTLYLMSRAGNASFSSGTVDEFRVYNRALTQSDVTALYGYTTPPPGTTNKFKNGDRVRITVSDADIYSSPTISSTKLGRQAPGALATVVAGPATAEGHTWYNFNFDSGVDGWDWQDDATLDNNPPPPPPPTNVTISSVVVTNVTQTSVTISWLTNVGSDSQVYYGLTSSYGSNSALNSTLVTSHTATLTGLTPSTVYHYQVRSGVTGSSAASTDATFTTSNVIVTSPGIPTGLTATPVSPSQINLAWNPSTTGSNPIGGYRVYRNGSLYQSTTGTGTTFQNTGLTAATTYSYTVAAYDTAIPANASQQSSSVSATTPTEPIACPNLYSIGARIRTTSSVNVRSSATNVNSSNLLGTQPQDALGTILAGPTSGNSLCWYNVNYDSGVDGWTGSNNITAYSTPTNVTISVSKIGTGSGTVTCGGMTCPSSVAVGTAVTFTAAPDTGSTFAGWTSSPAGLCSSSTASTCTATIGSNTTISATFNTVTTGTYTITVTKSGTGSGTVASLLGSINCDANNTLCSASITAGNSVTMNIIPGLGSTFAGVTLTPASAGSCVLTTVPITCTVNTNVTLAATFTAIIDTQAPSVPTNLTATAQSSSQINLSWTASTDNVAVAGYKIYRGGNQIGTVTTGTTYQDSGLSANTTYSYTVAAYDVAQNNSAQSSSASAMTQPPSANGNPIDPARRTTWNPGVPGGIPNRAVCTTLSPGSTVSQINSALSSSACDGKAVLLSEGTYNLSGVINVPTNRTLRGAGANRTKLVKTNGTFFMLGANSSDGGSANVSSGFNKDSRQLTLSSASGITTNHYLIISQNNPSYVTATGDNGTCSWCGENSPGRTMTQIVKVTGVSGNTVTINQPLYTNFSNSPSVKIISMVTTMAGVEDLAMAQTQLYDNKGGGENIHVEYCAYCWVKGVYSYKSNGNDHIWVRTSYGDEFRDNFFNDAWQQVSDRGYGIWFFNRNSDQLVINNIFKTLRHSVSFEGGGSGVVIAYNYMLDPYEQDNPDGLAQEMNYHGSHPFMNLWEGNYGTNIAPDNIFGSNSDSTYFRNYVSGQRPQRPTNYGQWIMNIQANSTRHNFVGNVMGFAGMASSGWTYESVSTCSGQIKTIWLFGCVSFNGTNSGRTTAPKTTAFISDNFDYVTNSVDSPLSYTLEPSMFLSGRPSWWGNAAWPPIGPDVSGKQTTIPAKTCYDGVASNPSNYNAGTCYGTSGPVQNTLTVSVTGSGTVTGTGISCPGDCSETFAGASSVALTAAPSAGNTFTGWSGACSGTATGCTTTVSGSVSVGATFTRTDTGDTVPPSAPSNFTATAVSSTQVNLSWTASTDNVGVTGYKIFRNGSVTPLATVTATSYSNTGLTANTAYSYAVVAFDAAGNNSSQSIVSVTTPPGTSNKFTIGARVQTTDVLNVRATASANGTLLGTQARNALGTVVGGPTYADGYFWWNVNFDTGVDGWSAENYLNNYSVTSFTLSTLKIGTGSGTITCNGAACPASVNSGTSVTFAAAPAAGSTFAGWTSTPAGLCSGTGTTCVATVTANTSVTATFNTVTSGTYTITATKTGNGTGKIASLLGSIDCGSLCNATITAGNTVTMTAVPDVGSTLTAFTLTPANSGTCLAMTPTLGTCTVSTDTTIAATFTAIVDTQAPSVPTGLVATALSSNSINITWTASTDNIVVAGYKVYRGGQLVGTVSSNSYQDAGLSPSTAYSYTVAAFDAAQNNSAQSSAVSATTQAAGNGQLIPADRAQIWNAGMDMVGGIPTNWPVSTTLSSGANVQSAINSAPANSVIMLSAGSYSGFNMRSNVIVRGAGADKTTINGNIQFDGGGYPVTDNQTIVRKSISSGYNKGSRQLTLASASGLAAGDYIAIYQDNDGGGIWNSGDVVNYNAGYACENGASGNHCVMQFNRISSISGNTINIDEPVYYPAYSAGRNPSVLKVQYGLAMAGLENLKVAGSGNGTGIYFEFARHSWLKGVEVYGFGGGNGQPQVMLDGTYGVEIRDSFLHGGPNSVHASGSDYGVEIYRWNSNVKIENNIVTETRHGILFESSGAGSVILYNYVDDNWESNTSTYGDQGFLTGDIGTHTVHPNTILFEGNVNSKMRFDYQLGTSGYNTVYRNWVRGMRSSYTTSWGVWLIDDMHGSNYYTYIGNVLGTSAFPSSAGSYYYIANGNISPNGSLIAPGTPRYGQPAATSSCQFKANGPEIPFVWRFGCIDNPGGFVDLKSFNTAIMHGNYDYGTRSTHWDDSRTQTLPASLYYGTAAHPARPTWWPSAVAWPPIGPDVANLHNDIPAKKCYDTTNVKSTGKFSAAACY